MTNNAKKAVEMFQNPALYLGIIVAMLGWYLPTLSHKVDENQSMERTKLQQIYEIKTTTHDLNTKVSGIEKEIIEGKKKNEYILKNVNDRLDIFGGDIRLLCDQIKRYGEVNNWTNHPECQSK